MSGPRRAQDIDCWVVSDGKAGMESQCLGVAETLGATPLVKRIQVRPPWRWLPPGLWPAPLAALSPAGDALAPPWPDLLIASGRLAVAPAFAVRRASAGRTFCVQLQDPTVDAAKFDLVVTPGHDRLSGPNVISTLGATHRVTATKLAAAAQDGPPCLARLPRPLVAVLLGGDNRAYRFTETAAESLGRDLARLARAEGAGLAVTPSPRTSPLVLATIRRCLEGLPAVIWDGTGENPYFAFLAHADALVVSGDSVNMVSEAAATGKPVFVAELKGGSAKFDRFHRAMHEAGVTRPFAGRLEKWSYRPPDDTLRVAGEIKRRMGLLD